MCLSSHSACQSHTSPKRLPRRLVDVAPTPKIQSKLGHQEIKSLSVESMPGVAICSTSSLPLETLYLTLSHCWGGLPAISLSRANLPEYSCLIPPKEFQHPLAATFRDAIQITRSLGFRYIWIDALCIIQDDATDKADEIGYMDQVYLNGVLNLSATAALNGSGGLIHARNPLIASPCVSKRYGLLAYASVFRLQVLDNKVNQRAWVLQERMLAKRILHFTHHQLFWECSTWEVPEFKLAEFDISSNVMFIGMKTQFLPHQRSEQPPIQPMRKLWTDLVKAYTSSSLSFRQDTLPGISALARVMCQKRDLLPHDYLAGLWAPDLPQQLIWWVIGGRAKLPTKYIAPSWSWAGARNPTFVTFALERDTIDPLAELLEASVTPKTLDTFGEIEGGHILLRAHLSPFRVLSISNGLTFQVGTGEAAQPIAVHSSFYRDGEQYNTFRVAGKGHPAVEMDITTYVGTYRSDYLEGGVLSCIWDHGWPDEDERYQNGFFALADGSRVALETRDFFLLTIGYKVGQNSLGRLSGLVLQRSSARGQYLRVGEFQFYIPNSKDKDCLQNVEELDQDNLRLRRIVLGQDGSLDDVYFLETHNNNTYTIKLI